MSQIEENCSVKYNISFNNNHFQGFAEYLESQSLYKIVQQVGEGYFGKIYKAENMKNNQYIALKVIEDDQTAWVQKMIENEKQTFQSMQNANSIIYCYNIIDLQYNNQKYVLFELELCQYDLLHLIKQKKMQREHFSEQFKIQVLVSILEALSNLHKRNIIHCDLKASNVLIKGNQIFLTDFGMATLNEQMYSDFYCGQPTLCSPEKSSYFSFQSDLFSLGLIVLMMEDPIEFDYESNSDLDMHWLELRKGIIPDILRFNQSSFFTQLSKQLLSIDPKQRGTSDELLQKVQQYSQDFLLDQESAHPFTKQTNIIASKQIKKQNEFSVINDFQILNGSKDLINIFFDLQDDLNITQEEFIRLFNSSLFSSVEQLVLNLYNHNFDDDALNSITFALENNNKLKALEICNEGNTLFTDEGVKRLFQNIKNLSILEKLSIFLPQNLSVSSQSLLELCRSVERCCQIQTLKLDFLYNKQADDIFLVQLGYSISKLVSPQSIYLSFTANSNFSSDALQQFQNQIKHHQKGIKRFVFSHKLMWIYSISDITQNM